MIVEVSFGHPQPTPGPNQRDVPQLHFPRATQAPEFSNTQTTLESDLALTVQPVVAPTVYVECLQVSSALSFCDSASPGFNTMNPSKQVSCLCYNSNFWTPASFGDVASDCDLYFSTQGSSINSQELSLNELCFTVTLATIASGSSTTLPALSTASSLSSPIGTPTPTPTTLPNQTGPIQSEIDIYRHETCVHWLL
jgi:hypothetical protein